MADLFEAYLDVTSTAFVFDKNIIFGKLDINKHDYPDIFEIEDENHCLFFVPSYNKQEPIQFTGNLEPKLIEKFIKTNLKKSNEHYKKKNVKKSKDKESKDAINVNNDKTEL